MPKNTHYKLIILGSGPSGLTAAIYAARANLDPLVVDGTLAGGQLMLTTDVENYPGFPEGIMGPDMMMAFRAQAERFGSEIVNGTCESVELQQRPFKVTIDDDVLTCDSLIISTGSEARWLGLESEQKYRLNGGGVSACAVCDGAFYRGLPLCVIGGGDSAMEEANFLTKFASKVYVIHRRDSLRASKIMQERALKNPKIEFVWNSQVEDVLGDGRLVTGIKVLNRVTGDTSVIDVNGVFLAIGHIPNTKAFQEQLDCDENGYIITPKSTMHTNIPGVFAAGDVQDTSYMQAITAAGTGCMAALDAERYLESLHDA